MSKISDDCLRVVLEFHVPGGMDWCCGNKVVLYARVSKRFKEILGKMYNRISRKCVLHQFTVVNVIAEETQKVLLHRKNTILSIGIELTDLDIIVGIEMSGKYATSRLLGVMVTAYPFYFRLPLHLKPRYSDYDRMSLDDDDFAYDTYHYPNAILAFTKRDGKIIRVTLDDEEADIQWELDPLFEMLK